MSLNLRYPNITGTTEKEQLSQIKSYLHQLVEQLNYALPTAGTTDGSTQPSSYEVQGGEMSYYELRSLIIMELQEVESLFDKLSQQIQAEYVKSEELDQAIDAAFEEAKESGDLVGPQGPPGEKGEDGVSVKHAWKNTVLYINSASGTSSADLKGEKGDPFTYEDFTEEQLESLRGPAGAAGTTDFNALENKPVTEEWTFTLEDGSTVTKAVYVG